MKKNTKPGKIELSEKQVEELSDRIENDTLTEDDKKIILELIKAVHWLEQALQDKNISIKKLLKQIFGFKTESSRNVKDISTPSGSVDKNKNKEEKDKPKGHGRNGIDAYENAKKEYIEHDSLKAGSPCPECPKGRLCKLKTPGKFIKIVGSPPLTATIFELEKLRCSSCQTIFTAKLPSDIGEEKWDESAKTIITLLKYGNSFPFYRLDKFQESMGVPLPASTQWDVVEDTASFIFPIFGALKKKAAESDILYNDDTTAKIQIISENDDPKRKGVFTTGIVSKSKDYEIVLYLTGKKHAGENLEDILILRNYEEGVPIQMCDALSRNIPKNFRTIVCNCLSHARRNFVELYEMFPSECGYVIDILKDVYKNDAYTKENKMSGTERLKYHQEHSKILMNKLFKYLKSLFDERKIEPNSNIGKAINYMISRWDKLTKFLEISKAPLDSNIVERALKKAILNRKNSYFFRTEHGALIGSIHMSIIQTCINNKVNPYNYYMFLLKNRKIISKTPEQYLPWNYQKNI